jgi:dUTP pyrophosphatase
MKMKIIIEAQDESLIPKAANSHDAGFDLRANEEKTINPGERVIIQTGIRIKIPESYVGIIKDRSGLAIKNGLHCMAGVIDSGYRGIIGVVIINLSKEPFIVEKGMRIAQMLVHRVESVEFEKGQISEDSERGAGGFGSSGLN